MTSGCELGENADLFIDNGSAMNFLIAGDKRLKKLYKKNKYDRAITLYNAANENYRVWGKPASPSPHQLPHRNPN